MIDYIKLLRSAGTAADAARIIDQCATNGDLADLLPRLDHDYIIDGSSRGYMAALITLRRGLVLDLRDGAITCKLPMSADTISHHAHQESNRIMEGLFLSGADID